MHLCVHCLPYVVWSILCICMLTDRVESQFVLLSAAIDYLSKWVTHIQNTQETCNWTRCRETFSSCPVTTKLDCKHTAGLQQDDTHAPDLESDPTIKEAVRGSDLANCGLKMHTGILFATPHTACVHSLVIAKACQDAVS